MSLRLYFHKAVRAISLKTSDTIIFAARITWLGSIVSAVGIIIWQSIMWLRFAQWSHPTLADGMNLLHVPQFSTTWLGLKKIVDWAMSSAISIDLVIVGFFFAGLMLLFAKALRKLG